MFSAKIRNIELWSHEFSNNIYKTDILILYFSNTDLQLLTLIFTIQPRIVLLCPPVPHSIYIFINIFQSSSLYYWSTPSNLKYFYLVNFILVTVICNCKILTRRFQVYNMLTPYLLPMLISFHQHLRDSLHCHLYIFLPISHFNLMVSLGL